MLQLKVSLYTSHGADSDYLLLVDLDAGVELRFQHIRFVCRVPL